MERKKYVDAVKGFNILIVLFSHAQGIPIIGIVFTACFMQVFFAIAGYTYHARAEENLGIFMLKKAKRLLVPYFTYGFSILAIEALVEKLSIQKILLGGVVCYTPGFACTYMMEPPTMCIC